MQFLIQSKIFFLVLFVGINSAYSNEIFKETKSLSFLESKAIEEFKKNQNLYASSKLKAISFSRSSFKNLTNISLPSLYNGENLVLEKKNSKEFDSGYSWIAKENHKVLEAIFIVMGDKVTAKIQTDSGLYLIEPLFEDIHVIIEVDHEALGTCETTEKNLSNHFSEYLNDKDMDQLKWENNHLENNLAETEIDVLLVYTPKANTKNIKAKIKLAEEEANESYQKSDIRIKLNIVHSELIEGFKETSVNKDLKRIMNKKGDFKVIHDLRDKHGADVVVLAAVNKGGICGMAPTLNAKASTAFAYVNLKCMTGYYTFAHEIGHLQGARHNPEQDKKGTYNHGFQYPKGKWRTIMSYACKNAKCKRLNFWSNPNKKHEGVAIGKKATHDNARALNESKDKIGRFRPSVK